MQCPFPGMDPYIERPAIWADFHDRLIAAISAALQPMLRPKYAALVQDRLYVLESNRPIRPDVSVVESPLPYAPSTATALMTELDQPMIFELGDEDIREPYIQIIEPAAGNRLITAIDVLSPDNKSAGAGRRKYLKKRREVRRSRANLVEIDLLRAGKPTLRITAEQQAELPPYHYLASVTRWPNIQEVYAIQLGKRLPTLAIPLTKADADVRLNLQAAFTRVWQDGPYPALLNYDGPPPGVLTTDEMNWCDGLLRNAGFRVASANGK